MGFRAPAVAAELFGAAAGVAAWALLADGGFAVWGTVGLGPHRRGLLAVAGALVVLPIASGNLTRPELLVPCALCAALLGRLGLVRWGTLERPPTALASSPAPPTTEATEPPSPAAVRSGPATSGPATSGGAAAGVGVRSAARVAGRVAGRTGRLTERNAGAAIPRMARLAGRVAGRARRPPDRP
jgi:hypothetical protein